MSTKCEQCNHEKHKPLQCKAIVETPVNIIVTCKCAYKKPSWFSGFGAAIGEALFGSR